MPGLIDRTGRRFGRLTVIGYHGGRKWRCRCDCGGETLADASNLQRGHHKSCGCLKHEIATGRLRFIDAAGRRFGRLTAISYQDRNWRCRCDCGKEVRIASSNLLSGRSRSCGCLRSEVSREQALRRGKRAS